MWLEETISPSTSSSASARLEARVGNILSGQSRLLWKKRKFSPTLTFSASSARRRTSSTGATGRCAREVVIDQDDDELVAAELRRLARSCARAVSATAARSPGRRRPPSAARTYDDRVGAADDLPVTRGGRRRGCPRRPARTRLDVGERGDPHPRKPTTGFRRPPGCGSAIATGPSGSASRTCSAPSCTSPRIVCPARPAARTSTSTRGQEGRLPARAGGRARDRHRRRERPDARAPHQLLAKPSPSSPMSGSTTGHTCRPSTR